MMGKKRTVDALTGNANSPTAAKRLAMQHPRLCKGHKTNGEPCGRYAIRGGSVCGAHGGNAPQVQRKAKQRLDFAKDMILARAYRGIPEPEPPRPPEPEPEPKPPPAQPAEQPPTPEPSPDRSGEVMAITKAQHEALKRGEHISRPASSTGERARPRSAPPWALPSPASPRGQLTTEEDALAAVARANSAVNAQARRDRKRRNRR